MKKNEFIDELCRGLRHLPPDEAQRTVLFYSEAIDDRIEDGISEEEAVEAMGDIEDIIREVAGGADKKYEYEYTTEDGSTHKTGEHIHRTFYPGSITRIEIFDSSNDIRLLPSFDNLIHVEYTAANSWDYNITEGSTLSIKRVLVRKSDTKPGFSFNVFGHAINIPSFDFSFSSGTDLIVRIPENTGIAASVTIASGDIECADLGLLSFAAKTASGDIDVRGLVCSGKISAATGAGDVEITGSSCDTLDCVSASGDIDVSATSCLASKLRSTSGDVCVSRFTVPNELFIGSVSGDIDCTPDGFCRKLDFESVSGDVSALLFGLPADYSISVKTTSGDKNILDQSLGTNALRVKTVSGDIEIEFRG